MPAPGAGSAINASSQGHVPMTAAPPQAGQADSCNGELRRTHADWIHTSERGVHTDKIMIVQEIQTKTLKVSTAQLPLGNTVLCALCHVFPPAALLCRAARAVPGTSGDSAGFPGTALLTAAQHGTVLPCPAHFNLGKQHGAHPVSGSLLQTSWLLPADFLESWH